MPVSFLDDRRLRCLTSVWFRNCQWQDRVPVGPLLARIVWRVHGLRDLG